MKTVEKIKVFIKFRNGQTVCICKRSDKRCPAGAECVPDVVERNKFEGWQETFMRDKYGM